MLTTSPHLVLLIVKTTLDKLPEFQFPYLQNRETYSFQKTFSELLPQTRQCCRGWGSRTAENRQKALLSRNLGSNGDWKTDEDKHLFPVLSLIYNLLPFVKMAYKPQILTTLLNYSPLSSPVAIHTACVSKVWVFLLLICLLSIYFTGPRYRT